jgi:Superinfection immunity protein
VGGLILLLILAGMYFLPTIIAFNRNRHNKGAIFVLNLFLGWTVLGWVVSMVWAVSSSQPPVIVVQGQQPPRP